METFSSDAPLTVAIVDDDPGVRDSLTVLLSASGYQTREYGSAEAFLREPLEGNPGLRDHRPAASRHRRPCAASRDGSPRPVMPVILVTAHGDVASARQALRTGAVDFLEKPIDNEELLNALRNAIEGTGPRAARAGCRCARDAAARLAHAARARGLRPHRPRHAQSRDRRRPRHQPAHRRSASRTRDGEAQGAPAGGPVAIACAWNGWGPGRSRDALDKS